MKRMCMFCLRVSHTSGSEEIKVVAVSHARAKIGEVYVITYHSQKQH
jgi:hypothetical protein